MRFELTTHALRMRCSTGWATSAPMFLFSRSAYVSSREKKEVDIGGEILETEIERQDVGMYSRMTGKTKVIMAIFGSILWTPGLKAEGFDIFRYKFCTRYFEEFYKYIAGLNFERIADHWRKSSSSSSDFLQKAVDKYHLLR